MLIEALIGNKIDLKKKLVRVVIFFSWGCQPIQIIGSDLSLLDYFKQAQQFDFK
jgi:hypothetical protein